MANYVLTQDDIAALGDVVLTVNGVVAVEGTELFYGDMLVATTPSGYGFYLTTVEQYYEPISSIHFSKFSFRSGEYEYLGFEIDSSSKVATTEFTAPDSGDWTTGVFTSLVCDVEQATEVAGQNNVYIIDSDILTEVNTKRLQKFGQTSETGDVLNSIDYGQFILSVLELPFSIDSSLILNPDTIKLGSLDTEIVADVLNTDKIVVDLGSVYVPSVDDNLLDYANTVALLHLPRIDPVVIELDYVIGETVGIVYIVDCYTGAATVNISSTKIDDVIITKKVDLGVDIPYISSGDNPTLANSNIEVGGDNGVLKPYIELMKHELVLPDGFFTIPITDEGLLGDASGFVTVDDVVLNVSATSNEKQEIINTLRNGVVIND